MIPLIQNSLKFGERIAVIDSKGTYSYSELHRSAVLTAKQIKSQTTDGSPLLYMIPSGFDYLKVQWAIWLCGRIAVPIHIAHPKEEIDYLIEDTGSDLLIYDDSVVGHITDFEKLKINKISISELEKIETEIELNPEETNFENDALMIYTSGTTGRPKGVVIGHRQLDAQIRSLSAAWEWSPADRILNVLPMHHIHGMVNISCCALYNGAILEMHRKFDSAEVRKRMSSGELTLFMAVPTIYHKLIEHFESIDEDEKLNWQSGMKKMRLMVSGSAALPIPVLEKWKSISGQILLERYGMTEIGMALSNPLNGERRPGTVGQPLPFVSVRAVDENGIEIKEPDTAGELYVKGDTVFKRYWNKDEETKKSFSDGWFKTGDVVEFSADGYYKILGRMSSDIIKSGGYKISALEIENVLLSFPEISECAVVGLADDRWGELIAAAIVGQISEGEIKQRLKDSLAHYKQPRRFVFVNSLPRNAMGKIKKSEVKYFF
ncbi:MAG: AMP-binding protein [Flavobacteriia bacterium]|nr:AMP-binding protein [Flavobacteriia bacterium]